IVEDLEKHLYDIRIVLYGDTETFPNADAVTLVGAEVFKGNFLELLIRNIGSLSLDSKRYAVHINASLQKRQIQNRMVAGEYLMQHTDLLDLLIKGYEDPVLALYYGLMLRECIRHQSVAKYVLESKDFFKFFLHVELPSFEVSSDAAATFRELLMRHKATAADFVLRNYAKFFEAYTKLLQSSSYITRRVATKLLADMLLDRAYVMVTLRFASDVNNLIVSMNLLRDTSKVIQVDAFHIFKVIVANPKQPQDVQLILLKNKDKLLRFLPALTLEKGTEAEISSFEEDKQAILKVIESMQLRDVSTES
ncbi:unnamed protein product, partial [Closterium sp. NIES-64]